MISSCHHEIINHNNVGSVGLAWLGLSESLSVCQLWYTNVLVWVEMVGLVCLAVTCLKYCIGAKLYSSQCCFVIKTASVRREIENVTNLIRILYIKQFSFAYGFSFLSLLVFEVQGVAGNNYIM